jgi:hypothetical protein
MSNKKNLDKTFDALYTLKKRNLLNQTAKSKKIQFFSSSEMALTRAGGLDDILSNITRIGKIREIPWSSYSLTNAVIPGPIIPDGQGNFFVGGTYSGPPGGYIAKVDSVGKLMTFYNAPTAVVTQSEQGGWPYGLAFYNGFLYASDMKKSFIYRYEIASNTWTILLGLPGTSGFVNGVGTATRLFSPVEIVSDNAGILYFNQGDNHVVSKYVISTGVLTTFAGTGVKGFADGPGTSAQFNINTGIFFDNSGNLIICDSENNRVRKIDKTTQVVTTVAGTGEATNKDGPVASATLFIPQFGCCDSNGNFYVTSSTDPNNNNINDLVRKISNTGIVTTFIRAHDSFTDISSIACILFYQGYIYLSDVGSNNIYRCAV